MDILIQQVCVPILYEMPNDTYRAISSFLSNNDTYQMMLSNKRNNGMMKTELMDINIGPQQLKVINTKHKEYPLVQRFSNMFIHDQNIKVLSLFTNVVILDLSWCTEITDNSLKYIADNLHRIQTLKLDGCLNITPEGIRYLKQTKITKLSIRYCYGCKHITRCDIPRNLKYLRANYPTDSLEDNGLNVQGVIDRLYTGDELRRGISYYKCFRYLETKPPTKDNSYFYLTAGKLTTLKHVYTEEFDDQTGYFIGEMFPYNTYGFDLSHKDYVFKVPFNTDTGKMCIMYGRQSSKYVTNILGTKSEEEKQMEDSDETEDDFEDDVLTDGPIPEYQPLNDDEKQLRTIMEYIEQSKGNHVYHNMDEGPQQIGNKYINNNMEEGLQKIGDMYINNKVDEDLWQKSQYFKDKIAFDSQAFRSLMTQGFINSCKQHGFSSTVVLDAKTIEFLKKTVPYVKTNPEHYEQPERVYPSVASVVKLKYKSPYYSTAPVPL